MLYFYKNPKICWGGVDALKEIQHELLADETNYIYFKYSGRKNLNSELKNFNADCESKKTDKIIEKDAGNKGLSSFHKAAEFWIILKGGYIIWINGEEITLRQGDILFIDSYKAHYYKVMENSAKIDFVFDDKFLRNVIGEGKGFPMLIKNQRLFDDLVALAGEVYDEWETLDKERQIAFIYRVVGLIVQRIGANDFRTDRKSDEFAKKIIAYLYANYDAELNIKTLAKEFGYTESYFSELFNKVLGMNLREYVNRLRVSVADKMKKEHPDMSLREISERVGYNSWVTFHRSYSKFSKLKDKNE